jgi:site-specific recombinase XerD
MFETLFHCPRACFRHSNGPLAKEREAFLAHLTSLGMVRETLLGYASELLVVAAVLKGRGPGRIEPSDINLCARQWAKRRRQLGHVEDLKWPAYHFAKVARAWCSYMGWLKQAAAKPFTVPLAVTWAKILRSEAGLSERTIYGYCWWATEFLQWLEHQEVLLSRVAVANVDGFIKHLASRGMARLSLYGAATTLRRFFRDAHRKGWCQRDLAPLILTPHLFRYENVPSGPAWPDVKRLLAATEGTSIQDLRNRSMLFLLAVYGLRCGEVTALRLEDLDWPRHVLRFRRVKTDRVQEYPLTRSTAQAIRHYLQRGRPQSARPELFLTLRAPFRPLSSGAVYAVTESLFKRLNIVSRKRGPHSLRHACATHLINNGFPLKAIGDHLGHTSLTATQIYAKVDLAGLRRVAAFDLGGLL